MGDMFYMDWYDAAPTTKKSLSTKIDEAITNFQQKHNREPVELMLNEDSAKLIGEEYMWLPLDGRSIPVRGKAYIQPNHVWVGDASNGV